MLRIAEKLDFQTETMVEVRQKTALGRQKVIKNLFFNIFRKNC
jgi:hypothetical protein